MFEYNFSVRILEIRSSEVPRNRTLFSFDGNHPTNGYCFAFCRSVVLSFCGVFVCAPRRTTDQCIHHHHSVNQTNNLPTNQPTNRSITTTQSVPFRTRRNHKPQEVLRIPFQSATTSIAIMTRLSLLLLLLSFIMTTLSVSAVVETNEEGKRFLAENAKKEGVITLPSGVQYKKDVEGFGTNLPLPYCPMTVRNHVKTLDGEMVEEPNEAYNMRLREFWLPAMREVLALLVEGDEVYVWMPAEHSYTTLPEENTSAKLGDVLVLHMHVVAHESRKPHLVKSILKCNPVTKEDCDERELLFSKNIYQGLKSRPERFETEAKRLSKHFFEPDKLESIEDHVWCEKRINILYQLHEFGMKRKAEDGIHLEF